MDALDGEEGSLRTLGVVDLIASRGRSGRRAGSLAMSDVGVLY